MTELIVALDGPNPLLLAHRLHAEAGVRWFKIGPQALCSGQVSDLIRLPRSDKIFLDLKLADTEDTCREAVRRFAQAGVAAVSVFTERAARAAVDGASGTDLKVWRVTRLTDEPGPDEAQFCADGVICRLGDLPRFAYSSGARVVPGIRFVGQDHAGHLFSASPKEAAMMGATHIVVGRPIWQSPDPVAAAKMFAAALS